MNEQEIEQEMNLGVAPSITTWLSLPENWELRSGRYSDNRRLYREWCAEQGLEPVS